MQKQILILKGDGIGPEIINEAIKILNFVNNKFNLNLKFIESEIGGSSYDKYKEPLTKETINIAKKSQAILLGAVGGSKWDNVNVHLRPEQGLLKIRKELNLFTNLRPVKVYTSLLHASTLKPEIINNLNIIIVRELTSGIYFGQHKFSEQEASDILYYSYDEITRITKTAFEIANKRQKKITLVDKANVLATSKLWRKACNDIKAYFPDVKLSFMYIDNAAMQLIKNPKQFDVILTDNMFGDILSDEASMLTGSIGMLPSASLNENNIGLYEPCHGSAPDIAGKNIANPLATILSTAMLFRISLEEYKIANIIEQAVEEVLKQNKYTLDITPNQEQFISTSLMGNLVLEKLKKICNSI